MSAMAPLRIVVAMVEPPAPFGDTAARWFYVLLKGLVARGHHVKAFATASKATDAERARALFPAPEYDLRCYPDPVRGIVERVRGVTRPYSYMFSRDMARDVNAAASEGCDILHLEQLWAGWLGLTHASKALVNVHHLVGIDLEFVRPDRWIDAWRQRRMVATERHLVRRLKHFRTSSPRLISRMTKFNPSAQITNVPLGLDGSKYRYASDESRQPTKPIVSVIGSHHWNPTLSASIRFLERLWPAIKARVPTARAQIVGWGARAALHRFVDQADVEIVQNVPDIQPYFDSSSVLLYAPSRGSGMKVKILEALLFGVPVVTTSEGVEGLGAEDGVHAGVSDDDEGLIERTVALLGDPQRQNRQRASGRVLVDALCSPDATVAAIEEIYRAMLRQR
jgi:glycosyltransferase involved in cell wall biosynthesis